jgi:hypothetical protein
MPAAVDIFARHGLSNPDPKIWPALRKGPGRFPRAGREPRGNRAVGPDRTSSGIPPDAESSSGPPETKTSAPGVHAFWAAGVRGPGGLRAERQSLPQ